ncbi:hypothetical protein DPMN_076149 [Dreissena polymorpha]|uniref:Ferric reductase NAD binding domain-containing protein n=1 Tax=Dreissena polymorpha TaxID=45954 RepID=A0A9D3YJK4_DREPO|nr:hypothetical protein DPMN_076149 [Dreissena polymorpha]
MARQQEWYTHDVSVLVGAGIGVTPYASILKDFVHMTSIKNTYKVSEGTCHYFSSGVTESQRHFEWLLGILKEVEAIDTKGMVSIDIFITQFFQNFDLRTAMLYICEEHCQELSGGKSVFTSLKANTHFGRPHLSSMFKTLPRTHPMVSKTPKPSIVNTLCERSSMLARAFVQSCQELSCSHVTQVLRFLISGHGSA